MESTENPETLIVRAKTNATFRSFLETVVTATDVEIYHLLYERDLSLEEAAFAIRKSPDAVAQAHCRLKRRLRKVIPFCDVDVLPDRSAEGPGADSEGVQWVEDGR